MNQTLQQEKPLSVTEVFRLSVMEVFDDQIW